MCRRLANTGVFDTPDDAVGGVGGAVGMKSEGMHATVATMDTMRTTLGTDPRRGLISCANCITH